YLRLWPPIQLPGQAPVPDLPDHVWAELDDVRLIEWSPRGAPPGTGATHVRSFVDAQATMMASPLPGVAAGAPTAPVPG
ncbi:MAG: hypothetical protein ACRDQ0_17440, partial [Pseudonocardia sp.]